MILGAQFDDAGRLWLFGQTAAEDWREGVEDGRIVDYAKWMDNPMEVVDVESKQVLCSGRFTTRYLMGSFAGPGTVSSYREDWLGRRTITVWELGLGGV